MDEQKETNNEETKQTTKTETETTTTEETGDKVKTVSIMDRADEINDRKERILKREEALQERKETFAARKMVGGETEGGQEPVKPKEETPKEYNDRIEKELSEGKHND